MCHKNRSPYFLFLITLLVLISACHSTPEHSVNEQPEIALATNVAWTKTPTPIVFPTETATATPTRPPLPTATNIPTETPLPTPMPACPPPSQSTTFDYPPDTNELIESMLTFLNTGGQWDDLLARLNELEIVNDLIEADMNGDGLMETAVYARLHEIPEHVWLIFQCTSKQYEIIHDIRGTWSFHRHFIVDDLNNDNRAEIITFSGFAGSACALEPMVWSWQVTGITSFSPSHFELDIGCSGKEQLILQDIDDDNIKEMIVTGYTVGHQDLGPPRGITQTFGLENTGYKLINTVIAPPDMRVHVLDDAQKALDANDLPLAILYYTQAAYEDMSTVGGYYLRSEEEVIHADVYQRAFALFRLAVIQLATGNSEGANSALAELSARYQREQAGHEFLLLAQIFFEAYGKETLNEACEQVTQYIVEYYEPYTGQATMFHHFYWGGNTASYTTSASFCPIFSIPNQK